MKNIECERYSLKCSKAFTVIELLFASFIGTIVLVFALRSMIDMKALYNNDSKRSELTQNLRIAGTLLNSYILQAGEYLPSTFPAIELTNGTSGNSDVLIIRRAVVSAIPKLCLATTATSLRITNTTPTSGCSYSGNTNNYNAWRTYRLSKGGTVPGYIYDIGTKLGEFFPYTSESNTGTAYSLTKTGTLTNAYTTTGTSMYLIQEMRISRSGEQLKLDILGEGASNQIITYGINNFSVTIEDSAGTIYTAFTKNNDWKSIQKLNIFFSGVLNTSEGTITENYSTTLYPRNILAN